MAGGPVPLRVDGWALATVAAPGAVLVGETARTSVGPWGDQAAIQLSVDRALHAGQLLGPYSRFGWSHPGPLYFYLLAGPYRALGSTPRALLVASVLLTVLAALAVVLLTGWLGGRAAARWSAAVVVAQLAALGPEIVSQVWNPVAIIVPTTLFLVCCAGLASGRWWMLVGVVAVGTFLVQTDVSTGLVVAVVALAALAVAIATARSSFSLRTVSVAVGAAALLWLAPVWQQATGSPRNVTRLLDFFRADHGGGHPWSDAARAVAGALWPPLRGRLQAPPPGTLASAVILGGTLLIGAGLVVLGWRRRRVLAATLAGAAVLATVAGMASATRVTGPLFAYLVEWLSAVPVVLVLSAGVLLGPPLVRHRITRRVTLGACVAAAVGLTVVAVVHPPRPQPGGTEVDALWAAARPSLAGLPSVQVALAGAADWPWGAGALVDATHAGFRATAQPAWLFLFGTQFTPRRGVSAVLWLWRPGVDGQPGGREVADVGDMAASVSLAGRSP